MLLRFFHKGILYQGGEYHYDPQEDLNIETERKVFEVFHSYIQ